MTIHGTRSRYSTGCRCSQCRHANASYSTDWKSNGALNPWQLPKLREVADEQSMAWRDKALCLLECHPTALFFPGRGDHVGIAKAKSICARCEVREECLEFSLAAGVREGVFGGVSEYERRGRRWEVA